VFVAFYHACWLQLSCQFSCFLYFLEA
jgi:hypothetical protein